MKRSVECVQKNWTHHNTPDHIHSCHTTYYHTNLCSKQKLLTVVTTRCSYLAHKKRQSRAKKIAFTAHIMRDKRAISFIQYVVDVKKAAITPPIFNYSVATHKRLFVVRMFAELYYSIPRHPIHNGHSPSYSYISHPLYLVRLY